MLNYDVAIIGGGAAGLESAFSAATEGLSVLLVEHTSGNSALIPGNYAFDELLRLATAFPNQSHSVNVRQLYDKMSMISKATAHNCDTRRIDRIHMVTNITERKDGSYVLRSDLDSFVSSNLIFATGSIAAIPRLSGIDKLLESGIALTDKEVLRLSRLPKNIVINGGSQRSLNMALYFVKCGSNVTLLCEKDEFCSGLDADIALFIKEAIMALGVEIVLYSKLLNFHPNAIEFQCDDRVFQLETDVFILGDRRWASTRGLGLSHLGVMRRETAILVDAYGRTNISGIYAAGDCTTRAFNSYSARLHAGSCVKTIIGKQSEPCMTNTSVSVHGLNFFCIGENLASATAQRLQPTECKLPLPFELIGSGLVKLIADNYGRLIGAHAIGDNVTQMFDYLSSAIKTGAKVDDIIVNPSTFGYISSQIVSEALYRIRNAPEIRVLRNNDKTEDLLDSHKISLNSTEDGAQ